MNFSGIDEGIPHSPSRLGRVNVSSGKIDSMTRNQTDSIVTSNALNFSQSGRSYLSGLGMPSDRYIDLTLGASGSTYTAPANGYFTIRMAASAAGQNLGIHLTNAGSVIGGFFGNCFTNTAALAYTCPVKKGQTVIIEYTCTTKDFFRFIYAQSEQ